MCPHRRTSCLANCLSFLVRSPQANKACRTVCFESSVLFVFSPLESISYTKFAVTHLHHSYITERRLLRRRQRQQQVRPFEGRVAHHSESPNDDHVHGTESYRLLLLFPRCYYYNRRRLPVVTLKKQYNRKLRAAAAAAVS